MRKVNIGINALLIITILVVYITFGIILKQPWYILLLAYAAAFCILIFLNRKNIYAFFGNAYLSSGNIKKSEICLKKALDLKTSNPVAYLNFATLRLREGDWEQALGSLEYAEKLKKSSFIKKDILLSKGSTYWIKGDIDKAIEIFEDMRREYDYVNGVVLTTLGYMYFLKQDYDRALEITNLAIKDMPESGSAWDNLGQIYYKTEQIEKAKDAFGKAIGFNPNLVDSLYFLGIIYEQEGNKDMAKEMFAKAKGCVITALNTVTQSQIDEKYENHCLNNKNSLEE